MSQPPQGQPPYGPDGQPSGGGWGRQQPGQPQQPAPGWEQPQQPGQGWGQQPGQPAPGGYGPPPGQGGWGTPPAPGYGEQPTQVGGFGVPGQPLSGGGPGWGGPGAPGGGGNNKKNMIITAVAALVLVVVVAVLVAFALRGNDEEGTTAGSSPSTSSSPSSSGGFSSEPSDVADPADFIGQLPADFVDCTDMELEGDGDLAAASCGAALTQPGPQMAAFYLYPDVATLDEVFADDVAEQGLTEFATGDTCSAGTGYGEWTYNDGTHGGQVACQLTGDGNVLISWTDDAFLTEGLIQAPGTSQAEVSALYDWWMSVNSEYQD